MSTYQLPNLDYDYGELEPVINGDIMRLHHQKHHNAYVTNLNKLLEQYQEAESKEDVATMIKLQSGIKFNGGGHVNHSIFWTNLAPKNKGGGGEPTGELLSSIQSQYGSFDQFKSQFTAKTVAIQGSGWGWLAWDPENARLQIATCQNQDPVSTLGLVPLLGVDVWEHAYYLQYKNARPDYVNSIWDVVNWKNVEERFNNAK